MPGGAHSLMNVCVCETGVDLSTVMIILCGLMVLAAVIWYLCSRSKSSKKTPAVKATYGLRESPAQWSAKQVKSTATAKSKVSSATAHSEQIYFSTTAVIHSRCYHTSDKCRGLSRTSSVVKATACKICVDNIQCFTDASFLD
jgi:hypothetical protein